MSSASSVHDHEDRVTPTGSQVEVLDDNDDSAREPTDEEVAEYAEFLGIDPVQEPFLMWIAREGVVAPVPPPWKACEEGEDVFYFNFDTSESMWDHPCDSHYKALVERFRPLGAAGEPAPEDRPPRPTDGAALQRPSGGSSPSRAPPRRTDNSDVGSAMTDVSEDPPRAGGRPQVGRGTHNSGSALTDISEDRQMASKDPGFRRGAAGARTAATASDDDSGSEGSDGSEGVQRRAPASVLSGSQSDGEARRLGVALPPDSEPSTPRSASSAASGGALAAPSLAQRRGLGLAPVGLGRAGAAATGAAPVLPGGEEEESGSESGASGPPSPKRAAKRPLGDQDNGAASDPEASSHGSGPPSPKRTPGAATKDGADESFVSEAVDSEASAGSAPPSPKRAPAAAAKAATLAAAEDDDASGSEKMGPEDPNDASLASDAASNLRPEGAAVAAPPTGDGPQAAQRPIQEDPNDASFVSDAVASDASDDAAADAPPTAGSQPTLAAARGEDANDASFVSDAVASDDASSGGASPTAAAGGPPLVLGGVGLKDPDGASSASEGAAADPGEAAPLAPGASAAAKAEEEGADGDAASASGSDWDDSPGRGGRPLPQAAGDGEAEQAGQEPAPGTPGSSGGAGAGAAGGGKQDGGERAGSKSSVSEAVASDVQSDVESGPPSAAAAEAQARAVLHAWKELTAASRQGLLEAVLQAWKEATAASRQGLLEADPAAKEAAQVLQGLDTNLDDGVSLEELREGVRKGLVEVKMPLEDDMEDADDGHTSPRSGSGSSGGPPILDEEVPEADGGGPVATPRTGGAGSSESSPVGLVGTQRMRSPPPVLDHGGVGNQSARSSNPSEISEDFRSDWGAPSPPVSARSGTGGTCRASGMDGQSLDISASVDTEASGRHQSIESVDRLRMGGTFPPVSEHSESERDSMAGRPAKTWPELEADLASVAALLAKLRGLRAKQEEYLRAIRCGA